jgi:hypothetical protein
LEVAVHLLRILHHQQADLVLLLQAEGKARGNPAQLLVALAVLAEELADGAEAHQAAALALEMLVDIHHQKVILAAQEIQLIMDLSLELEEVAEELLNQVK